MKRLLQLLLVAIVMITLAACAPKPDTDGIDCDDTTVTTGSAITVECE